MNYKQIIAAIEADEANEDVYTNVPAPTDADYVESNHNDDFIPTDNDMAEADLARKVDYAEEYLTIRAEENWQNSDIAAPSYEDYISAISGTDIKDEDKLTQEEYSNLEQYLTDFYYNECAMQKTIAEYGSEDRSADYPDEWLSH